MGVAFLPGATLARTKAVLEDYDHQKENYSPDVRQSKLLSQSGNTREIFLQFYSKTLVTAVFNVNMSSEFTDYSATRTAIRSCSTRVAEVDDFGKPEEHELRPADSHGYLWELCTWWHIEEKNSGTYIQVEAIELSRTVPFGFGWLINPLIRNVPKAFLSHLLNATKKAVSAKSAPPVTVHESLRGQSFSILNTTYYLRLTTAIRSPAPPFAPVGAARPRFPSSKPPPTAPAPGHNS